MNLRMFHWRRPALWLCLPVVIVLAAGIWFASREFIAARRYEATIQTLRNNSRPVSNADLQATYESTTRRGSTRLWNRALFLVNSLAQSPATKFRQLEPQITPGEAWEYEVEARQLLEKARPVLDLIHEATQSPSPVWQPIEFDGFNTQLWAIPRASYATALLTLDAEDALRRGEGDRAIRAIRDIFGTADAFDVPVFMISQHINNHMRQNGYSQIRHGLSADVWSAEQIDELYDLTSQRIDISKSWQQMVDGDVGAMIASLDEKSLEARPFHQAMLHWIATLPSGKDAAINKLLAYRDCPTNDFGRFRDKLIELSSAPNTLLLQALDRDWNFGWHWNIGEGLARAEDERRLAATSLAIKKFQLAYDRWPEELSELVTDGLPKQCLTSVDKQPFGYETKDGVAYTWKYRLTIGADKEMTRRTIPSLRPTKFANRELLSTLTIPVTTIR